MVAIRDFSGLLSSPWALARAAAMAPMVSLERCIGRLQQVEADGPGFGTPGPQAVSNGLPGILRNQLLQVGLGPLMLLIGRPGPAVGGGKFGPGVRGAHIDH